MKFTIEHYMWGYQRHYRTHVKVAAEHVLNPLDEGLNPDVFLVGILQEDRAGRHLHALNQKRITGSNRKPSTARNL